MGTCDCSVRAAASKAFATAERSAAATTEPPPALANCCSTELSASGLLNATTSALTFALESAVTAAARALRSPAAPPARSATVSPPSLSRTMLRSPSVPSPRTASWTAAYNEVSPSERSALTALWTFARSVVGSTSMPEVSANDTTPTLTSAGTLARKSLTADRTVTIPDAFIDPLVSMTSIVVRCVSSARTVTLTACPPSVPETDAGSTTLALSPRMMSVPVTAVSLDLRSLSDASTVSASARGAPATMRRPPATDARSLEVRERGREVVTIIAHRT